MAVPYIPNKEVSTINTIGERIKQLRKQMSMTQQEFADRIGIKRNTVAQYETGKNQPLDAVISLICREFHINEAWLRTGIGEMKADLSVKEELDQIFKDVLKAAPDKKSAFLAALAAQPPEFFDAIAQVCLDTIERMKPMWEAKAPPKLHVVKIAGRDGSYEERHLTDDEVAELQAKLDQLPDASDDL